MGKGTIHLYVDRDLIDRAKLQEINLSAFFEDALRIRLNIIEPKADENEPLLHQIAKAEVEVSESQRKLAVLKMQEKKIKDEEESMILERREIL